MSNLDYKVIIRKKAFALLITIILLTLFSFLSISIIENQTISSNIDKLKYLHLQSQVHMKYIKDYIKTHSKDEIKLLKLEDSRFNLEIIESEEDNQTIYNIAITTVDDTTIRIHYTLVK